jgi:DNA-binding NarL/FixJ family response regulator
MSGTKTKRIRILLVDDHPVVREGLRRIISTFDEIEITGEARSGREAISRTQELKPDVVVMDISMPEMTGIEAISILTRDAPEVKVLALSMHDNRAYVQQALAAGARGYLLKDSSPNDLVQAISNVFEGALPISPQAANVLVEDPRKRAKPGLTPREIDVLRFVARGFTNKEIGIQLGLGVRTVETHRENLMRKTGLPTVAELTRYAVTNGYVQLNSAG